MPEAPANAIECLECGTITEIDEGDDPTALPCPTCEENEEADPYCHHPVRIEPCPKRGSCDDEHHHHGRGDHVIEVEL